MHMLYIVSILASIQLNSIENLGYGSEAYSIRH
jgi:hypothetical protein